MFDVEDDSIEYETVEDEITEEEFINNISNYSSNKLCEIIVCYRYLKINKNLSIICMEELSKRRLNGDSFLFEEFIDTEYNKLPKLDFSIPDFQTIVSSLGGLNGR
jgi:hypothetical protein